MTASIDNYTEILLFPGWWDDTPLEGYELNDSGIMSKSLYEATQAREVRQRFRDITSAEKALRKSFQDVFILGRAGHPRVHHALFRLEKTFTEERLRNVYSPQAGAQEYLQAEYLKVYREELTRFLNENILPSPEPLYEVA